MRSTRTSGQGQGAFEATQADNMQDLTFTYLLISEHFACWSCTQRIRHIMLYTVGMGGVRHNCAGTSVRAENRNISASKWTI